MATWPNLKRNQWTDGTKPYTDGCGCFENMPNICQKYQKRCQRVAPFTAPFKNIEGPHLLLFALFLRLASATLARLNVPSGWGFAMREQKDEQICSTSLRTCFDGRETCLLFSTSERKTVTVNRKKFDPWPSLFQAGGTSFPWGAHPHPHRRPHRRPLLRTPPLHRRPLVNMFMCSWIFEVLNNKKQSYKIL